MTPDELWEKYSFRRIAMHYDDFSAALKEHGEAVRKQAAEIAEDRATERHGYDKYGDAAAIEKMEMP